MASWEPVRSLPLRWVRVSLSELTRPRGAAVAMILVPEAVAFAFMTGLKPLVGLQVAWIMCLIAGLGIKVVAAAVAHPSLPSDLKWSDP